MSIHFLYIERCHTPQGLKKEAAVCNTLDRVQESMEMMACNISLSQRERESMLFLYTGHTRALEKEVAVCDTPNRVQGAMVCNRLPPQ